jgi:hypothetical protein
VRLRIDARKTQQRRRLDLHRSQTQFVEIRRRQVDQ